MKIISKHKDYYDHLVSTFGYDETRVYDRRNPRDKAKSFFRGQELIAIAGKLYPVVIKDGRPYLKRSPDLDYSDNLFLTERWSPTHLNEKYRQPVLIECGWQETYAYVPILAEFGFAALIPAEEMYMTIYNYLGWLKDNPVPPNTQTNKDKVIAHGFDAKRSFRPKMKG